jgi:hypothetical protein
MAPESAALPGTSLLLPKYFYLKVGLKARLVETTIGVIVLFWVFYAVWRSMAMWKEMRQERQRLKENLIWMRQERKRRCLKTVGILTARERREAGCGAREETSMKRVRFVDMLDRRSGCDLRTDATLEVNLGGGGSPVEQFLDEGLGEVF